MSTKFPIICLIGAPGSGKGTIGSRLATEFDLTHLSVGDLLREMNMHGHFEKDPEAQTCLSEGKLLPTDTIVSLLKEKFEKLVETGKMGTCLILDGFPRAFDQALNFELEIQRFDLMIYLDCPEEVAEHRYLSRQRRGDDQATFATRYTEFLYKNQDIMDFYKGVRKLVKTIGSGTPTEGTYRKVLKALRADPQFKTIFSLPA